MTKKLNPTITPAIMPQFPRLKNPQIATATSYTATPLPPRHCHCITHGTRIFDLGLLDFSSIKKAIFFSQKMMNPTIARSIMPQSRPFKNPQIATVTAVPATPLPPRHCHPVTHGTRIFDLGLLDFSSIKNTKKSKKNLKK
jgi:hypothetical protein